MNKPSRLLAALCFGGFLSSLWALFQWGELLVARAGGTPFCAVSGTFDCSAVWDSGFAKTVHEVTRVPVAGWGLMWGIVAFALPLLALVETDPRRWQALATALRVTALAGAASVVGLIGASAVVGHVCIGCMGTYVVVAGWSVAALTGTKGAGTDVQRGLFFAGGLTLVAYLVLLVPGTRTPHALADVGKDAIAHAVAAGDAGPAGPTEPAVAVAGPWDGPSTGEPTKDNALDQLLEQLPPDGKQAMSDLLKDYDDAPPAAEIPAARVVVGEKNATSRIVDWTDPLCPHCAELHEVVDEIRKVSPPGTLSIEPHFYPLDGLCNPSVQRKNESGEVRCAATKALLCLESDPDKFVLAQKLVFENQAALSVEKMWEILRPFVEKKKLEACMASAETQKKLDADIAAANKNHLEGTPLVLFNGKEVKPFGPILYALALTGGKTHTLAFKSLPPPKPLPPPPPH